MGGVRAVTTKSRQARGDRLADRRGDARPAVQVDQRGAVYCVVERLTDPDVVERCAVGIQGREVDGELRVRVHDRGVLDRQLLVLRAKEAGR